MSQLTQLLRNGGATLLAGMLLSCQDSQVGGDSLSSAPMPVQVSAPVPTAVTEYKEFTGRLDAPETVELRARVSGYLDQILFEAGAEVKKGDVLFIIDQRPYKNELTRAEAEMESARTAVELADSEMVRARRLNEENAVATKELERRVAELSQARASLQVAQAAVESARLDLEFTEIKAPIDGKISQEMVTVGNLIQGGTSAGQVLATIVTVDPLYVYVDADERSVIEYRGAMERGELKGISDGSTIAFELGLIGQEGFPYEGAFDYVDNQLNPSTGTLRIRGVVDNPKRLLSPGMFARVRIIDGNPYEAFLIHERAILTDQGNPFVYVVSAENSVEFRPIETGPVREGLRVVKSGLSADDRVIVAGVMRLRPGATVEPKESPMPRPGDNPVATEASGDAGVADTPAEKESAEEATD